MAKHGGRLEDGRTPYCKAAKLHRWTGDFAGGDFSNDFDISRLVLVMADQTELVFEDVVAQAVRFWEEFFSLHGMP